MVGTKASAYVILTIAALNAGTILAAPSGKSSPSFSRYYPPRAVELNRHLVPAGYPDISIRYNNEEVIYTRKRGLLDAASSSESAIHPRKFDHNGEITAREAATSGFSRRARKKKSQATREDTTPEQEDTGLFARGNTISQCVNCEVVSDDEDQSWTPEPLELVSTQMGATSQMSFQPPKELGPSRSRLRPTKSSFKERKPLSPGEMPKPKRRVTFNEKTSEVQFVGSQPVTSSLLSQDDAASSESESDTGESTSSDSDTTHHPPPPTTKAEEAKDTNPDPFHRSPTGVNDIND
ncbi:hypothetical protein AMATHDRAFT_41473 [Amanita thiersii Skay4041]|uniref:Uncharacterized protein n=1 Tax=Amanita thiersii Skay4041 TaxID=703135 RepID=A0A2A9NJM0_9AGAR|nr:hypothetical protein AMATHDRAFT_41473 [Amanita thiersii Skay4041]